MVSYDYKGKNVLVTGGSRGIGKALVKAFAEAGAHVTFTYRSSVDEATALEEILMEKGQLVRGVQADAVSFDDAEKVIGDIISAQGSLDVIVNNAGITRDGLLLRMSEADWDAVLETNLKSVFNYCKAAYRPLMKQRSGRIINISSVVGVTGNAGQANYAASKAGVIGFSKSLAKELASRNISVNVVAPGYFATDMTKDLGEKALEAVSDLIPFKRQGEVEELAGVILFLASDAAGYITGQVLNVDGGMVI